MSLRLLCRAHKPIDEEHLQRERESTISEASWKSSPVVVKEPASSASSLSIQARRFLYRDTTSNKKQSLPQSSYACNEEKQQEDDNSTLISDACTPSWPSTSWSSSSKDSGLLKVKTQEESLLKEYNVIPRVDANNCIRFGHVTTHYHEIIIGDHPEVSTGVPVSLGSWEGCDDGVTLAQHEEERAKRCQDCPWHHRSKLSSKERERMLIEAGISYQTIRLKINSMKVQNNLRLRARILSSLKDAKTNASAEESKRNALIVI